MSPPRGYALLMVLALASAQLICAVRADVATATSVQAADQGAPGT